MMYFDLENRLVALSEDTKRCAVWQEIAGEWALGSEELAGKTWAEGQEISPAEAARRFPEAEQAKMPELDG